MTAAADDEPPASAPGKAKHKRTRTGCMKCRVRRRKCDEGKPRCQRCIDGGFECQYGPRLTFLDKNVMTVGPAAPAAVAATTTSSSSAATTAGAQPQYARLQFVNPPGAPPAPSDGGRAASPMSSETLPSQYDPPPPDPKPQAPPPPQVAVQDDTAMSEWQPNPAPITPQTPGMAVSMAPPRPPIGTGTSPKDPAYETALNVLISLGSDMPTPGFPSPSAHAQAQAHPRSVAFHASPASTVPSPLPPDHTLTQDRLLQLLRYYRYQVAPWLDICDMGQAFGLAVARLAVDSEGALSALLALAARAQHDDGHAVAAADAGYLDALSEASLLRQQQQQALDPFADASLAQVALAATCRFATAIPAAWQSPTCAVFGEHFLAGALEHAGTKMRASILTLLLRLELSAAMVNGTPLAVPDEVGYLPDTPSGGAATDNDAMFRYATGALLLCAQAVSFHASPFAPQAAPGTEGAAPATPVSRWTRLNDALAAWYAGRPHEFRPMAEMEGEESLFPVVLFTNGAAVLANQLYHTAMLLLLQSRPRTLQAAAAKKSAANASHLWHAQRVCGICLNNDRRDSWDLCLVASLFLAAQRLTYEPQQRAILDCLNRVRIVTGWDLGGFAAELQETWGGGGG